MSALLESHAPSGLDQAEAAFLEANPSFHETSILDELRATEYGRLDAAGDVYLDYTGGSLYAESQVEEHMRMLRDGVFGNPHSANPTSSAATALVEQARAAVLRYFNAPESEYACIFTPNATGAMRLVGEAYPFDTVPRHRRQPQLGQRHPASSPARREPRRRTCRSRRPIFAWPGSRITSTRPTAPASSPIPRSPTSRASSIRWSGSTWPMSGAGTCSWTAPRSRRRAGSTCRCGSRTSSRSRSTRCSATRPAWAR